MGFLVFCLIVFICWFLFSRIYFSAVSCVVVVPGSSDAALELVIPTKKWFKDTFQDLSYGCVKLGSNLYAYYCQPSKAEEIGIQFNIYNFPSTVYVFSRSKLGKLRSVDLSSRSVSDIIKKFNSNI